MGIFIKPKWLRIGFWVLLALAGLIVLANVVTLVVYHGRVLPNSSVADVEIGGMSYSDLEQKVRPKLLVRPLNLQKADKQKAISPGQLGLSLDWIETQNTIKRRNLIPIFSLFRHKDMLSVVDLDNDVHDKSVKDLIAYFAQDPLPERVVFNGQDFLIASPEDGYELDPKLFKQKLLQLASRGKSDLKVPVKLIISSAPIGQLESELTTLKAKLDLEINLTYKGKSHKLSRSEIGNSYVSSDNTMKPDSELMRQVLSRAYKDLGVEPVNSADAVRAALYSINKSQATNFVLADSTAKVYRYCVAAIGVDSSDIEGYRQKLAATYGDPRGWTRNHNSTFVNAETHCDFVAWLSSPSNMTSFGAICDSYYSCNVGENVVVNFDRWQGATDPWNASGGGLEDYRVMVINHETGHWLGFGHRSCSGAGQPAPVMQQQSINLNGCKFNPWPTDNELSAL